jgi:hypothetical protein
VKLWHLTADAPRIPQRVLPGDHVGVMIGTWPIEPGQEVWITYETDTGGGREEGRVQASWIRANAMCVASNQ